MTDFQQIALNLASSQSSPDWLQGLRERGALSWQSAKWPSRKTEMWKYTPLTPLQQDSPAQWAAASQEDWQSQVDLIDIDATRLVFVNGQFAADLSSELPSGVVRFADANADQQQLIQQKLGTVVDAERHLFAALSNAWASDGILIHVPAAQSLASRFI